MILFSGGFEILLIGVLLVATILLLTGKGDFFLRNNRDHRKRSREQELYMQRQLGFVTMIWLAAEVIFYFFGKYPFVIIIYIIALVISIVYLIRFFNKN